MMLKSWRKDWGICMQLLSLNFLFRQVQRQSQPVPFSRTYDATEAKAHYLKKKSKDEESVFLMTRKDPKGKDVIDYDLQAVQGYNEMLWEEKIRKQDKIHNKIQQLIDQKDSMPSGSNFFARMSGNSGKINRAKAEIDEAVEKLKAALPKLDKQFENMMLKDNLPILKDKVQKKVNFVSLKRKRTAGASEQGAVNVFEPLR